MDAFDVQILEDGRVKSSSGPVSPENHQSAEAFLKMVASLLGGESHRERLGTHAHGAHEHHHHREADHGHAH